jgi:ABC-type uncharacterized transport system auxiliary subunit
MKKIISALMIITAAACMSSPPKRYFQLNLGVSGQEQWPHFDKNLLLGPVIVDDVYSDYRIIYRVSAYELNYYAYEFWAEKPDQLVGDALADALAKRDVFLRVDREISKATPDFILRANVRALEEIDRVDAWAGRLAMGLDFVDFKTEEILASHSFDRTERLPQKEVSNLAPAISRILGEELKSALEVLAKKLSVR